MNALFSLSALGLLSLLTASATHAQTLEGYTAVGNGRYSNQFASGKMGPTIAAGADVLFARRFGVEGEVGLDEFFPTVSLDGMVQPNSRFSSSRLSSGGFYAYERRATRKLQRPQCGRRGRFCGCARAPGSEWVFARRPERVWLDREPRFGAGGRQLPVIAHPSAMPL
jgi:hypothetical protein